MKIKYIGPPAEAPVLGLLLEPGKFYEVASPVAQAWVDSGVAEFIRDEAPEVAVPQTEQE